MNENQKLTAAVFQVEDDLVFDVEASVHTLDGVSETFTNNDLPALADLLSDGDVFGATSPRIAIPEYGEWQNFLNQTSAIDDFFDNFETIFAEHEVIIADGVSEIHDSSLDSSAVFAMGEQINIYSGEKILDVFLEPETVANVDANNTDLTIYALKEGDGYAVLSGTISNLTIHLLGDPTSQQDINVSDEKIYDETSGKLLVDFSSLDSGFHEVSIVLHQEGSVSNFELPIFADGSYAPSSQVNISELEVRLEDIMEEDLLFNEGAEVQLTVPINRLNTKYDETLFDKSDDMIKEETDSFAESASFDMSLANLDDLLEQDTLFSDPLDIIFDADLT